MYGRQISEQHHPPLWKNYLDQIATNDGILFKGERVIVLSLMHGSHMGEKCKRSVKEALYQSGMNGQAENVVKLPNV